MRRLVFLVLLSSIAGWACTESTNGITPGPDDDSSKSNDDDDDDDKKNDDDDDDAKDRDDAPSSRSSDILINEISGGDEWIELVNSGSEEIDLSGWKLADRDKDTGEPKLEEAVTFPEGTKLAPNDYWIVRGGGLDKECPAGTEAFCVKAEFGISNSNGETIFLIDTDDEVVGTAEYPANGAGSGETWGRIPSGDKDGEFQITAETPGDENEEP